MKCTGQDEKHILVECTRCGRKVKVEKTLISETPTGYLVNNISSKLNCICGKKSISIDGKPYVKYVSTEKPTKVVEDIQLKCPKCKSTNLTANNKGFGLGKAAVGGILLGPVGLLGGLFGSKKPVFICLNCGNQFEK